MTMKYICALVTVDDIVRAKDFYVRCLGQKILNDFGENVQFENGFALHDRAHFSKLIGGRTVAGNSNSCELYFEEDDIDTLYDRLASEKICFIHPVREQPWRQRVMRFYDPDGNIIEIAESLEHLTFRLFREGMSVEGIASAMGVSADFVRDALDTRNSN